MTDDEILAELQSDTLLNKVRRIFAAEASRIEQAGCQQRTPTPIEHRYMEFKAAEKIINAILNN